MQTLIPKKIGVNRLGTRRLAAGSQSQSRSVAGSQRSGRSGISYLGGRIDREEAKKKLAEMDRMLSENAELVGKDSAHQIEVSGLKKHIRSLTDQILELQTAVKDSYASRVESNVGTVDNREIGALTFELKQSKAEQLQILKDLESTQKQRDVLQTQTKNMENKLSQFREQFREFQAANNEWEARAEGVERFSRRLVHVVRLMGNFLSFNNDLLQAASKETCTQDELTAILSKYYPSSDTLEVPSLDRIKDEYRRYFNLLQTGQPTIDQYIDGGLVSAFDALAEWETSDGENGQTTLIQLFDYLSEDGQESAVSGEINDGVNEDGPDDVNKTTVTGGTRAVSPFRTPPPALTITTEYLKADLAKLSKRLFADGVTRKSLNDHVYVSPPRANILEVGPKTKTTLSPAGAGRLIEADRSEIARAISDFSDSIGRLYQHNALLRSDLSLEENLKQLTTELLQSRRKLEQLEKKATERDQLVAELREKVAGLEVKASKSHEVDNRRLKIDLASVTKQAEEAGRRAEEANEKFLKLSNTNAAVRAEKVIAEENLAKANDQIQSLTNELSKARFLQQTLRQQAEKDKQHAAEEQLKLTRAIESKDFELAALNSRVESMTQKLTALADVESIRRRAETAEARLAVLQKEHTDLKGRLGSLEITYGERASRQLRDFESALPTSAEAASDFGKRSQVLREIHQFGNDIAARVTEFSATFAHGGTTDIYQLWDALLPGSDDQGQLNSVRPGTILRTIEFFGQIDPTSIASSNPQGQILSNRVLFNRNLNGSVEPVPVNPEQFLRAVFWGEQPSGSYPADTHNQVTWGQVSSLFNRLRANISNPVTSASYSLSELRDMMQEAQR